MRVDEIRDNMRENIRMATLKVSDHVKALDSAKRYLSACRKDLAEELRHDYTTEQILGPGVYMDSFEEYTDHDGPCIVYMDSYYIEIDEASYSLILGSSQYESQCLRELESILAEYARDEGLCYIEQGK